ncbi:MAG: PAS domain-containing protein [Cyclobacteriaceae bacterium]
MQKANAELLRLRALEELKEKKARLASLIDSMSEAILEIDAFGFITMANPAASLLFGFSQKDFEGILVFSLPLENGLGQVGSSRLK